MNKKDYCCCTGTVHCRYCVNAGKPPHLTVDKEFNTILLIDNQYDYSISYHVPMLENHNDLAFLDKYKMNINSRTQADAISAIRAGHFLVGSVSANGDFSVSTSPVTHSNATSARIEAKRLASITPGKAFVLLKLAGAELVPTNSISI